MIVEIIYNDYEKFKFYVKLKYILSFDTESKRILFKKSKVGYRWISDVQNFDEILELWKTHYNNNL